MDIYKLNFTILQIEVFSLLCQRAGEKLSQRDIAKMLKVSPTAITNSIPKLQEEQLIKLERSKTVNFISFNRDYNLAIELKRVDNLKNIYLSGLSAFLEQELAGFTIILFGSYSLGEDINTSDIDIAVIGRKSKTLSLEKFEKMLNRKININFYDSWSSINKHLKNNIFMGIVLHGSIDL